jgi:hypothetical protein
MVGKRFSGPVFSRGGGGLSKAGTVFEKSSSISTVKPSVKKPLARKPPASLLAGVPKQLHDEAKLEPKKPPLRPRNVEAEVKQVREKKQQDEKKKEEEERILAEMRRQREEEEKAAQADAVSLLHSSSKKKKGLPPWAQKGTKEKGVRKSV